MRREWKRWQWVLLLGVALAPRLVALGRYITPDELIWVYRSIQFREAWLAGNWADTLVSGHPGMPTIISAALSISLQQIVQPASQSAYAWITQLAFWAPENTAAFHHLSTFLTGARLAVALINSLGVLIAFFLARRLFGERAAWLGAILLALDPFVAGLSGLLHVDGLMTTFAAISLLAWGLAVRVEGGDGRGRWKTTAVAALFAALAILSKTPALLLLPLTALFWLLALAREGREEGFGPALRHWVGLGLLWTGVFAVAVIALYPALWGAPGAAFELLSGNAGRHIQEALRPTFFLGRVTYDHGPAFYPVVLAFRLSPVVLGGLLLGAGLGVWRYWGKRPSLPLLLLALWSLLFLVGISFAAKKFDRYALPAIPSLIWLAVVAWDGWRPPWERLRRWLLPLLVGLHAAYLLFFLPYPLSAYNPLAGGPWLAVRALPVGWGESVSAAGRWLAEQPGAAEKTAVTGTLPSLAPFFPGEGRPETADTRPHADYLVIAREGWQRDPADVAARTEGWRLLHTIRYGGLIQGWIYQQPAPRPRPDPVTPLDASHTFGQTVQLRGVGVLTGTEEIEVYIRWGLAGLTGERFQIQFTLEDEAGNRWAQREAALVNEVYFYPESWAPEERPQIRYELSLPPAIPPGTYHLSLSLFTAEGSQLPLQVDGRFQGTSYPFPSLTIPPSPQPAGRADVNIPVAAERPWRPGLTFLGHDPLPESVITGGQLPLDLYWRGDASLPSQLSLTWRLGDVFTTTTPLSRYDTGRWTPGTLLHEKYTLRVPSHVPGGVYVLQAAGEETAVALGQIEVIAADRRFTLPEDVPLSLNIRFGDLVTLRGLDLPQTVAPGETATLTLYWEAERAPGRIYAAFVHVVGPEGGNAAQSDHWPGGLPSNTWAAGQVIEDQVSIELPPDLAPGRYELAVGVYDPESGIRLPAVGGDETAVSNNRFFLPVPLTVRQK